MFYVEVIAIYKLTTMIACLETQAENAQVRIFSNWVYSVNLEIIMVTPAFSALSECGLVYVLLEFRIAIVA